MKQIARIFKRSLKASWRVAFGAVPDSGPGVCLAPHGGPTCRRLSDACLVESASGANHYQCVNLAHASYLLPQTPSHDADRAVRFNKMGQPAIVANNYGLVGLAVWAVDLNQPTNPTQPTEALLVCLFACLHV